MQAVIPHKMRMLEKAHVSHQGLEACIRLAKDVIYWPGMTAEIQQQVSQCGVCYEYLQKQQRNH